MNKADFINDVIATMIDLDKEIQDRMKITLTVKLQNLDIVESVQLPSTEVRDNEYIFQRFTVDMLAKGLKISTVKSYLWTVKRFVSQTGKSYTQITGQDIVDYLAFIQYRKKDNGQPYSKSNAMNVCKNLFVFFQWAYKRRHLPEDITRDVDRIKCDHKIKERLTKEEIEQCRDACVSSRDRALFELMMSTGMRVGEIRQLKISDINLKKRTIDIHGYKTENADRVGVLTVRAEQALNAYIGSRTSGYVFISDRFKNIDIMSTTSLETISKKIGARAGCHCVTTVHTYRRTFASEMYQKTHDVKLVSKLLGHGNASTTEKYYLVDNYEDITQRALMVS